MKTNGSVAGSPASAPHAFPKDQVIKAFGSDLSRGFPGRKAQERLLEVGPNKLEEEPEPGLLARFMGQMSDFLVLVLLIAGVVSAFLGEILDAAVIGFIILLNAVIGLVQEGKAKEALKSLKRLAVPSVRVLRDAIVQVVPGEQLVPGDIILLESGDRVPGDARLLESHSLRLDESSLTGESVPVDKDAESVIDAESLLADRKNMVYAGTIVTAGRGKGLVTFTGMKTEIGKIAGALKASPEEKTPLQKNLAVLGKSLSLGVLAICGGIFLLGLSRGGSPIDMFLTAVSLAVAAIPEGLPAVVTIVLAIGVKKMASRNAIVRRLPAVETLGSITVICSDKTGTITQNKMTVVGAFAGGKDLEEKATKVAEENSSAGNAVSDNTLGQKKLNLGFLSLFAGATLANDAIMQKRSDGDLVGLGDPTEVALALAGAKAGLFKSDLEHRYPRVAEIPFDSVRKRMTTVHEVRILPNGAIGGAETEGKEENEETEKERGIHYVTFVKGAPEILLNMCTKILNSSQPCAQDQLLEELTLVASEQSVTNLDPEQRKKLWQINDSMAKKGLRVIAVAFKVLKTKSSRPEDLESDLTFVGFLQMIDPPRPGVDKAVERCKKAGIVPVMITGDNVVTASAIAGMVGILQPNGSSSSECTHSATMSGSELAKISTEDLSKKVLGIRVYGRVSPEDKVKIVEALKLRGHVVAMTGDGVNDAPALRRADIGVAMGLVGTDVARDASDMVLSDDNFSTIVRAVEEGRIIYSNIAKFVVYLLSCNMGEIVAIVLGMLMKLPPILRPVQILWLNLVTDSFPALALGFEPGDTDVMVRRPRPPKEPLLTRYRWNTIMLQAILIGGATLLAFLMGMGRIPSPFAFLADKFLGLGVSVFGGGMGGAAGFVGNVDFARTLSLATLGMAELLRSFGAKSERISALKAGIFRNRFMLFGNLISFGFLMAAIEVPFMRSLFATVNLGLMDWLSAFVLGLVPVTGYEISKVMRNRK